MGKGGLNLSGTGLLKFLGDVQQGVTWANGEVPTYNSVTGEFEPMSAGGNNFANANLTFDANRTHNLNGFNLLLEGGDTTIKGIGNTALTDSFTVQNSSGNNHLIVDGTGQTTIKSSGSSQSFTVLSVQNSAGNEFFKIGGDGVFELGANANNSGNTETNVCINGTTAGANGYQLAIGTFSTGCFGTGLAQIAIGYNADINTSNSRVGAMGSDVQASNEGFAIGNRITQTAKDSFIIGSGTGISTRLTNTTTESLALGFNSTTPNFLFSKNTDSYLNGQDVAIGSTTADSKLYVAGDIGLIDGMTAPSATVGKAKLYIDSADGDLKIIFGDGTIKTITTDT